MKRIILLSIVLLSALLIARVHYMLQPTGHLNAFETWTSHPHFSTHPNPELVVQFFGVSTLLIDDGQDQILIDGFFSRPSLLRVIASPIQRDAVQLDSIIKKYQLSRLKAIAVSHSHYDHALDVGYLAKKTGAQVIGSSSTHWIARAENLPDEQLISIQPHASIHIGDFIITPIRSRHTPPTFVNNDLGEQLNTPLKQPAYFSKFVEGGSYDFLIEHGEQRMLIKASTDFVNAAYKDLEVDTLFLGIAQLSKQSAGFQQAYFKETLDALNPKVVIPIHWDDFFHQGSSPLRLLPRLADDAPKSLQLTLEAAQQRDIDFLLMDYGHKLSLPLMPIHHSTPSVVP